MDETTKKLLNDFFELKEAVLDFTNTLESFQQKTKIQATKNLLSAITESDKFKLIKEKSKPKA